MYLVEAHYRNAYVSGDGTVDFRTDGDRLRKWSLFSSEPLDGDQELFRLITVCCYGPGDHLGQHLSLSGLVANGERDAQVSIAWIEHFARNQTFWEKPRRQTGVRVTDRGGVVKLDPAAARRLMEGRYRYRRSFGWSDPARCLVLGYGSELTAHAGSDDFDFGDAFFQQNRVHSLFSESALLTDPSAFLSNLHYRGVRCGRHMPAKVLASLQQTLRQTLRLNTTRWMERHVDFAQEWTALAPREQLLLLPVLDAARHLHDALPRVANPLDFPGVMLLHRPDIYLGPEYYSDWLNLLDRLFPAMQFLVSVPQAYQALWPQTLLGQELPQFPTAQACVQKSTTLTLPRQTILLVDVDGRLPNLALMKLAGHYRAQGRTVELARKESYAPQVEAVFASSVFHTSASRRRLQKMQSYYGDALTCGGSGVDVKQRLPQEIEEAVADYTLYPELGDRAIGFLTRGCPFRCPFCLVPIKEGKTRQASDLDTLLAGDRHKLILLDDNILSFPDANELLREMAERRIQVNFNQTLDLSLVDEERARLLRAIDCQNVKFTRPVYYFSLNNNKNLDALRRNYDHMGFRPSDNVEFICMYGYDTTLAEDVERFRFLRSLSGAYVFVQEYQPIIGGPAPKQEGFFDDEADNYIDELVRLCFTQNMKSMEKYYRWVSRRYAEHFGVLHMGLVDAIFRYNHRYRRGKYIATLAGVKKISDVR